MTTETYNLTLTSHELTDLFLSVSAAAVASYTDDRLRTACDEYKMAAKLADLCGFKALAKSKRAVARSIGEEIDALRAEAVAEEDA